ncbi:MAG: 50S ribosome-binding GTPase [Propionibacteriaceae bacterium]|nr:50S ribosome-binding GTPase [Propionibacteriaceae bacterium]
MRIRSFTPAAPAPSPLATRVRALDDAATLAAGRSDPATVAEAKRVATQVDRRLAFSGANTVVALAGATGSGKSSLFNAVSGTQLATSGVRRPTTDATMAACWGAQMPSDLLAWLDIAQRHPVIEGDPRLAGLVLLDLPDHDSTTTGHRDEVDRLVRLVDGLIWVLDPQKYADAALHNRYLKPLADYADVMVVALNHADLLSADELAATMADLRKLLDDDGLAKTRLVATSALTGQGVDNLRTLMADLVASKRAAAQRLSVDVSHAAQAMLGDVSRQRRRAVSDQAESQLVGALSTASGVPQVVAAVDKTTRQRGAEATGWPLVSWINRLKPDPLRAWRTSTGGQVKAGLDGAVAGAQVDAALRDLAGEVTVGMTPGWVDAVKQASTADRADLPRDVDAALGQVDLGVDQPMRWWRTIRIVQWVLIGIVALAIVWALLAGFLAFVVPSWRGVKWTLLLIIVGVVLGLLLALACHLLVSASAARRAARAGAALRSCIAQVARAKVVDPVNQELDRYAQFTAAVARAL